MNPPGWVPARKPGCQCHPDLTDEQAAREDRLLEPDPETDR